METRRTRVTTQTTAIRRRTAFATAHRLAREHGVPYGPVLAAIRRGDLPALRLSDSPKSRYLVQPQDFERWLASRVVAIAGRRDSVAGDGE
jgi:cysteine synthase